MLKLKKKADNKQAGNKLRKFHGSIHTVKSLVSETTLSARQSGLLREVVVYRIEKVKKMN